MKYATCPTCVGDSFVEAAEELTLQDGVRIVQHDDGHWEPDYDQAGAVELIWSGEIRAYTCEKCSRELEPGFWLIDEDFCPDLLEGPESVDPGFAVDCAEYQIADR